MAPRLELQALLKAITENVYFQPPSNITMKYPCIIYERDAARTEFADNDPYNYRQRYMITVIDRDPDSEIPGMIARLRMSTFNRFFTSGELNHDVFSVYF